MKLHLLFLAAIAFVLTACKSKDAFDYSQKIVGLEKSLAPDIQATEDKVADYAKTEDYDGIAKVAGKMEDEVADKIKEIKNMPAPDVKEGENFKKASIKYFEFMKSVYTTYVDFARAKTPEEREEQRKKIQDIVNERESVTSDMQAAQQKFATANGFKVEKK